MNRDSLSIDQTELSVRSKNALHRIGVHTVGDMLKYTETRLQDVRNLGSKSIAEILAAIEKYSAPESQPDLPGGEAPDVPVEKLEFLSAKEYNILAANGCRSLRQILQLTEAGLLSLPHMDSASAKNIYSFCLQYEGSHKADDLVRPELPEPAALRTDPAYHDILLNYVKANDPELSRLGLSARPAHSLSNAGYRSLSEILFLSEAELLALPSMGRGSAAEVLNRLNAYLAANEAGIRAVVSGDTDALWGDAVLRPKILSLYAGSWFDGFSFSDFSERLALPPEVGDARLKGVIGRMIADGSLEYVDYRCHRVYSGFAEALENCQTVSERSKDLIRSRLAGNTLEAIAQKYELTKERVRQIIGKSAENVRSEYKHVSGADVFDEDYYLYFFATYDFDRKIGEKWFGISAPIFNYLSMTDAKRGKMPLDAALNDTGLSASLRLKIKNYLNRNKIFIDGVWVEKNRSDLEKIAVKKFCTDTVGFDEFCGLYNQFLEQNDVPCNDELYYTETGRRSGKKRLSESRFLLWKQNEQLRYYDIDERDYTELIDTLGLETLENVELSTLKFFEDYPELMAEYDIRDQYELHNLLRKTVPEGSFHGFRCTKMPTIAFGEFDRTAALFQLLSANAPISAQDLADLIHKEYGYDQATVLATYLQPLSVYYHQGEYRVDQKPMPPENRALLAAELTDDFYFLDEIRALYQKLIPGADPEEINSSNLKQMGFTVLSRYALQNYSSLEAYFTNLLTKEKTTDLLPYRKRFGYVMMFSQTLWSLKRSLKVVEFEPGKLIRFRDLEEAGFSADDVQEFCDAVYDFTEPDSYFTIAYIKNRGFTSPLFDLGFSDWFYANLLVSDSRFSWEKVYGNMLFFRGGRAFTTGCFLQSVVADRGSINVSECVTLLTEEYAFRIAEKWDVTEKLLGTDVFHDRDLDRLYANIEVYYRELGI